MSAPSPDERVGPYRLLERAGAGGMGVVYRAEHVETGAVHALKVLLPGGGADVALRMRREAEALGRVDHPNVVRVHSAGEDGGRVWIAMEWVAGGALTERLSGGALEPLAAAALVRSLAQGVAHVHACGVLHRDIKPANVLLTADGTPKLTDFGLARLRGAAPLTQTGEVVGTPVYMAPEQAQGSNATDERTDVYGLGALLYHLLTGRPPFAGSSLMTVLVQVATAAPARPRSLEPRVPAWLEEVWLRARAKAPDARYPSATALAEELGRPSSASASRRTAPLVVAALVAVAAASVAIATRAPSSTPSPAPAIATPDPSPPPPRVDVAAVLSDLVVRSGPSEAGKALDATLARGEAAASGAAREWALTLAATRPELAEQVARAASLEASPATLLLAAEVSIALGRGPEALDLAQRVDLAGSNDRSRRALVLALALSGRLADANRARLPGDGLASRVLDAERLRAAIDVLAGRFREEVELLMVVGGSQPRYEALAGLLLEVERGRPDQAYAGLGRVGPALARRFMASLLALDGELSLLHERTELVSVGKVDDILTQAAGAAPDLPEANALRAVGLWARSNAAVYLGDSAANAEERRAVLAGLDQALQRPLPERQASIAGIARFRVLRKIDGSGMDRAELARAEALIDHSKTPSGSATATFVGRHPDRVASAYLELAWNSPAERASHVAHVLAICDAIPPTPSVQRPVAKLRILATLLAGRTPSTEDLSRVDLSERILVEAVLMLANDDASGAIRHIERLASQSSARRDAQGVIALAKAVEGDRPGALAALERSRTADAVEHWLYWCYEARIQAGIDMIERGEWRPSPTQPFPPP